jgi:GT2 family glycosyltransferase
MSVTPTLSVIIPTYNRCQDSIECIESILSEDLRDIEIICIDNASTDKTFETLINRFEGNSTVLVHRSAVNLGASGGRNLGAKIASGKELLFLDSDNVIEPGMIETLLNAKRRHNAVLVGPIAVYFESPAHTWYTFADISLFSSLAKYRGNKAHRSLCSTTDIATGHALNCFLVSTDDFWSVDGFDERYFIMYEEADLSEKLRRKHPSRPIMLVVAAITRHKVAFLPSKDLVLSSRNASRVYLTVRNRLLYMGKFAPFFSRIFFKFGFLPLIAMAYFISYKKAGQPEMARAAIKGLLDGLKGKYGTSGP